MAAIRFDKVSKRFPGGEPVITSLELEVHDGELLVLVGPSGCGKSTVLRMVAGLEEVSGGEIYIGDRRINDLPPQQRQVAMVFQNYALYPHMSVRDNLAFPLRMQKLPREAIARRVEETARMLNLDELLERRPKALSGGQRQRVAMGRAIIREAEVYLMDEPLSNLDAKLRAQIRTEIATLQARLGVTTIYVTHDQVEAMTLGQRVAVMHNGRLQQVASPHELYERPANIFVAGFIGSPGMNVLRGSLVREEGELTLQLGPARLALSEGIVGRFPRLTDYSGGELLVGIRPEALRLAGPGEEAALPAELIASESLGHETILHFRAEVETVATDSSLPVTAGNAVAIVPGHRPTRPGESILVGLDTERLFFFDSHGDAIG